MANQDQAQAQVVQAALLNHDRVRRTTDIPVFHGRQSKDTIQPQQLIERLEKAARVAGWDQDQRKCDEFSLSLRDNALSWYNTLDNIIDFDKNNWAELKKKFLEAYAPKYSAKALCICFQDLRQKNDENVQDFYNRVSDTFRNAYEVKPAHTITYTGTLPGTATQAECNEVLKQGVKRMQLLMLNTVFLGGLKEEIRNRVLESGPTEPDESVKAAREIESIISDKKRDKGVYVTSIGDVVPKQRFTGAARIWVRWTRVKRSTFMKSMQYGGERDNLHLGSECGPGVARKGGPTGQDPGMASTGQEPSFVSSATSQGTRLPNVMPERPEEAGDLEDLEDGGSPRWTGPVRSQPETHRSL